MIGSDCCVGPDCCFRKLVQCLCLHVHSVLLHSWFGIRAFIAIRRFALGIQINQGRLGQLGNALHPMLSTIDNRDMRMACFRLQCRCTPGVSPPGDMMPGYLAGSGPCYEHPRRLLLAPLVAPRHRPAARRGHARSKESSAEPALRPRHARQAKCPRRNRLPISLHDCIGLLESFNHVGPGRK